jgi:threonine dehydrogenase-like Zn-dependent dehydrogenase
VTLALDLVRRGGAVILSGIAGGGRRAFLDSDVFALKHLRVDGVFAYTTDSFEQALRIIESGKLDVRPLVTHTLPLQEFERAFDLLSNRPEPVVKVMLKP